MLLLQTLSSSEFQEYVEHPLLEAFVRHKFDRVKVFFWLIFLLPTLLFAGTFWLKKLFVCHKEPHFISVIFSIYAVLLFGQLCKPDEDDDTEDRWLWQSDVDCVKWTEDTNTTYITVQATWVILMIFNIYFWLREMDKMVAQPRKFFSRIESFGYMAIDILLLLCLYKGYPQDNLKFERWQLHVATVTSFLLWVQTMLTLGKYPGYGKYIIMFK